MEFVRNGALYKCKSICFFRDRGQFSIFLQIEILFPCWIKYEVCRFNFSPLFGEASNNGFELENLKWDEKSIFISPRAYLPNQSNTFMRSTTEM